MMIATELCGLVVFLAGMTVIAIRRNYTEPEYWSWGMIVTIIHALFASLTGRAFAAVKNTWTLNFIMQAPWWLICIYIITFFLYRLVILSLLYLYTNSATIYITNVMHKKDLHWIQSALLIRSGSDLDALHTQWYFTKNLAILLLCAQAEYFGLLCKSIYLWDW